MGWLNLRLNRNSKAPQAPSLNNLQKAGDAARDRRSWDEAARFYEQIVRIDPSALDITIQLGHAHKEMGNYDRAAELYSSVLTFRPTDDDLHLQIGHLEKVRRNFKKAMRHYQEAADLNPLNTVAQREYHALKMHADVLPTALEGAETSLLEHAALQKTEQADPNLESSDTGREEQAVIVGRTERTGHTEYEHEKPTTARKSSDTLLGVIARPSWVAGRLPQARNEEDGVVLRVSEVEHFLLATHAE